MGTAPSPDTGPSPKHPCTMVR